MIYVVWLHGDESDEGEVLEYWPYICGKRARAMQEARHIAENTDRHPGGVKYISIKNTDSHTDEKYKLERKQKL